VSVLVVAQSSSEVPEGLMNNPVYYRGLYDSQNKKRLACRPEKSALNLEQQFLDTRSASYAAS
jgi:hypothetical protein